MTWHVIEASEEQIQKLFDKHCKDITRYSFTPDDESDGNGWVSLNTSTDKVITYQFSKQSNPSFVEFKRLGTDKNVRYDVHYPVKQHPAMANFLRDFGEKARKEFWEGCQI